MTGHLAQSGTYKAETGTCLTSDGWPKSVEQEWFFKAE
jgi:hypothetical protein